MNSIIESFVTIAPYINQLTNTDFAVSVCDLEKCLIYIPGEKQDHKLKSGSVHVKNSVSYDCVVTGKKIVRRVSSDIFGFPYIAIAIPIHDEKNKVVGCVSFTEAVDKQDLLLALADNLHATIQQMLSITDVITDNSLKIKNVGEDIKIISSESNKEEYAINKEKIIGELRVTINRINERLGEILNISTNQIEINNYINSLVKNLDERAEKIKEYAHLLSE